ncbi:alpha/beta fold hydrolase [Actinomadura fibrosa]|uniref:Alpha/beta fold hydrolase n=2 Tax=Actinomadura fibrosa TaxID=111802 RepID=A0ABW2XU92_9ACTN
MMLSPKGLLAATSHAASNAAHLVLYGRLADLRPMPADPVDAAPERPVYRYRPPEAVIPTGPPVLLVPPLAAPARCYDLRRGCSLAEHVVATGRRGYLLDCGPPDPDGRDLGLREWVDEVLPGAIRAVSRDAGGQPVQLVGWCLGGLVALLAAAADPGLPIASVAMIGTAVDPRGAGPAEPARPLARLARGSGKDAAEPMSGDLSQPVVKRARRRFGIDRYVLRPYKVLTNLHNADFLAQIEAVDHFTGLSPASPGLAAAEISRGLSRDGDLAAGGMEIGDRRVELARVGVPVLAIAGRGDALAPPGAVRPLTRLLPGAPDVRFAVASGGHLGVLTGRSAKESAWLHLDRWLDEGTLRHGIRPPRREPAATL